MYYGYSFIEILPSDDDFSLSHIQSSNDEKFIPFHILIGADGKNSGVRYKNYILLKLS